MSETRARVELSVVVPTIGRPGPLRACLESLAACDPGSDEVLVVDQSRGPEVAAVTADFAGEGARVVACEQRGVAIARNVGLRAARHDAVAMTDDDCTVDPAWAGIAHRLAGADPEAIYTGRVLPLGDPAAVPATKTDTEAHDYSGELDYGALYSNNVVLSRTRVLDFGAFDEQLETAEDNDLGYRWLKSGRSLRFEPGLVVWHHDWRTPDQLERLYRAYGRGQGAFYAKHLRAGDLRMLRFIGRDLYLGLRATAAGPLRGRPKWSNERRGVLLGMPVGFIKHWRRS